MQKITPHLWFDKEAKEAAEFYVTVFPESKIKNRTTLHNTPSGTVDILTIDLLGHEFTLISAGPYFKINPSISFLIACDKKEDVDMLWQKLSMNGTTLMELGSYPFSGRYGWIQDRHGVSWQIMLTDKNKTCICQSAYADLRDIYPSFQTQKNTGCERPEYEQIGKI